jgi:DNA helicase-2/ATP-dependent DNA helicase PcrA
MQSKSNKSLSKTLKVKRTAMHLAIIGVAGSGKTTQLEDFASNNPSTTKTSLLLTYSVSAKENLITRINSGNVEIKTLHSFCLKLIVEFGNHLGYQQIKVSEATQEKELRQLIQAHSELQGFSLPIATINALIRAIIASSKAHMAVETWVNRNKPEYRQYIHLMNQVRLTWQRNKIKLGTLSFDDQLRQGYKLIKEYDDVRAYISERYNQLLVDEFQDLSEKQMAIVHELSRIIERTVVAGDDAQIVYGFCNGTRNNFDEFLLWHSDADVLRLNESYRLTQPLANFANAVQYQAVESDSVTIISNKTGPKPIWVHLNNQDKQDKCLLAVIHTLHGKGVEYHEMTVVARLHSSLAETFRQLAQHGIPASYGDYNKIMKMANTLKSVFCLIFEIDMSSDIDMILEGFSLEQKASNKSHLKFLSTKATDDDLAALIKILRKCRKLSCFEHQLKLIASRYLHVHRNNDKKIHGIHLSILASKARGCSSVNEVLEMIDSYLKEQGSGIQFYSIHKIKSQEYKAVFLIDVMEGKFPFKLAIQEKAIKEEWRLFYVALTRSSEYFIAFSPSKSKKSDFYCELRDDHGLFKDKRF